MDINKIKLQATEPADKNSLWLKQEAEGKMSLSAFGSKGWSSVGNSEGGGSSEEFVIHVNLELIQSGNEGNFVSFYDISIDESFQEIVEAYNNNNIIKINEINQEYDLNYTYNATFIRYEENADGDVIYITYMTYSGCFIELALYSNNDYIPVRNILNYPVTMNTAIIEKDDNNDKYRLDATIEDNTTSVVLAQYETFQCWLFGYMDIRSINFVDITDYPFTINTMSSTNFMSDGNCCRVLETYEGENTINFNIIELIGPDCVIAAKLSPIT